MRGPVGDATEVRMIARASGWASTGAGIAVLLLATAGRSDPLAWEGSISLDPIAPGIPEFAITGSGVATLNGSGGGIHLTRLRLAGGIAGSAVVPITDPDVGSLNPVSMRAALTLGTGTLAPFDPPAPPTAEQLTRAALPVRGVARLCLVFTDCRDSIDLDLTRNEGGTGVGVGGLLTEGGAGLIRISVLAAPWTVRTASIPLRTSGGGTVAAVAAGWRHGAFSFTSSTALPGGAVSLVTPLAVTSDDAQALAMFARLTVRFVPEPAPALLLSAGVPALLALAHLRSRQRRRIRCARSPIRSSVAASRSRWSP